MSLYCNSTEFNDAVEECARRLDVLPVIVEKDYWVTQVLRSMSQVYPADWLFKGGTCLSKAYGLINRFSEDIDVLILKKGRGKGSLDKLMKQIAETSAIALGDSSKPRSSGNAERGIHRSYALHYGSYYEPGRIAPYVILEMGVRGGEQPSEIRLVRTLLAPILE